MKIENYKLKISQNKGVSLYLTIVILSVLTAALLALITISISQIKVIRTLGNSVIAFYAADTGVENMLLDWLSPVPNYSGYLDLNNNSQQDDYDDSFYEVTVTGAGPECDAHNYCVESIGRYRNTKRAIEIKY